MYKADLWRLCKLYIHGGVYTDVDIVPYLNIDTLDKSIDFYSCLNVNSDSIFQAFIATFASPKHPLLYVFLLSFLLNNPYQTMNGPTYDMYNCIKYMINRPIVPDTKYELDVKIKINIGSSKTNVKHIFLHYFPNLACCIRMHSHPFKDKFSIEIKNNILIVTRIDSPTGWGHSHIVDLCFNKATILLFQERGPSMDKCFVVHRNQRILDSRDNDYYKNNGY